MATSLPDDDPRRVWQTQTTDAAPIDIDEIRAGAVRFRRTIRRRNLREHVAGAVVTAVFAFYAWAADGPWTRTGALLVIAGNLYVGLQISRRGWSGPAAPDTPVIAALRADLERQRDALRSVWRWYLLPYVPGLTAFAVGVEVDNPPVAWVSLAIYLALGLASFAGIAALNQAAAREMQREIDRLDKLRRDG